MMKAQPGVLVQLQLQSARTYGGMASEVHMQPSQSVCSAELNLFRISFRALLSLFTVTHVYSQMTRIIKKGKTGRGLIIKGMQIDGKKNDSQQPNSKVQERTKTNKTALLPTMRVFTMLLFIKKIPNLSNHWCKTRKITCAKLQSSMFTFA